MVDHAVFALRAAERNHLLDNFGNRVRFGTNRSGARHAAERPHAAYDPLRLLALEENRIVVYHNNRAVADRHNVLFREIERHAWSSYTVDVNPTVRLRPAL